MYFRPDTKVRIRFLQDMDDGLELVFHDSFEKSLPFLAAPIVMAITTILDVWVRQGKLFVCSKQLHTHSSFDGNV